MQSMSERLRLQRMRRLRKLVLKEVEFQNDVAELSKDIAALKEKVRIWNEKRLKL